MKAVAVVLGSKSLVTPALELERVCVKSAVYEVSMFWGETVQMISSKR